MAKKDNKKPEKKNVTELENRLKRVLADYDNLTKRIAKDQVEFVKFANKTLLTKLLPVLDDLGRAQNHLKDDGLELVLDQFKQALKEEEIKVMDLKGQKYDPEMAECVEIVTGDKDKVLEIVKQGYTLHDRVLRPAHVKVGGK